MTELRKREFAEAACNCFEEAVTVRDGSDESEDKWKLSFMVSIVDECCVVRNRLLTTPFPDSGR
jgi:hypothetical protein